MDLLSKHPTAARTKPADATTADGPLVKGEPVRVISLNPGSEAARAVSMGQTGIVANISGTEVLVDFADNKFPFDRDQIARVSTARSSAGEGGTRGCTTRSCS